MSPFARSKFRYQVTPSDRQLWAIGMVVAQWALLEQLLAITADGFTDKEDANDPLRKHFESLRGFDRRMDALEGLIKSRMKMPWQGEILGIMRQVRDLADLRDKIVHGTWVGKLNAQQAGSEAHGVSKWIKPGPPFEWKLNYGGIVDVAVKIDDAHHQLMMFLIGAWGSPQDFTVSDAIKRILT